jgi:hypothetical protein
MLCTASFTSQAWVNHQPLQGVWLSAAVSRYATPIQGVYERSMPFAGLQSLLSVQSSYQLSQHSTAALALTYQQGAGLGMQVTLPLLFALPLPLCLCLAFNLLPSSSGVKTKSLVFWLSHAIRSCSLSTEDVSFCSQWKALHILIHTTVSSIWLVTVIMT